MVGSSPLARGTLPANNVVVVAIRLIPARTGNTTGKFHPGGKGTAHPRSRGEHSAVARMHNNLGGSSPLALGIPIIPVHPTIVPGVIPAHAGNTPAARCPGHAGAAHPRSRGEHNRGFGSWWAISGSSPLARGTLLSCRRLGVPGRLIPARARNTTAVSMASWMVAGSSPLARGTLPANNVVVVAIRLIPARAGSTSQSSCNSPGPTAHPRSRGEHIAIEL